MSLRKQAKILGISPTYLSLILSGRRPWRGNLKERYEELVNTFVNTDGHLGKMPLSPRQLSIHPSSDTNNWREREGVEPTPRHASAGATDLKSARATGPHPLPHARGIAHSGSKAPAPELSGRGLYCAMCR